MMLNAPNPQPGQVWYAWVRFDEDERDGKDRPCLVLHRDGPMVDVLKITSDSRGRPGYIPMPTASWDASAEDDSWLRLAPSVRLNVSNFRRPLGLCDIDVWQAVSHRSQRRRVSSRHNRTKVPSRGRLLMAAVLIGTLAVLSCLCGLAAVVQPDDRALGVAYLLLALTSGLVGVERLLRFRDAAQPDSVHSAVTPPVVQPRRSGRPITTADGLRYGTVAWFDPERGYGFIDTDDGGRALVYHSDIRMQGYRSLNDGQRVTFRPASSERGPRAADVRPMD